MRIRPAQSSDLPTILVITNQASTRLALQGVPQWQGGYPSRHNFEQDIAKNQLFVAINESQNVVGFASISLDEDPNYNTVLGGSFWTIPHPSVVIHRLAVDEQELGRGIAQALYHHAEVIAQQHGRHSLKVDTHEKNLAMNRLIRKMGYQLVGTVKLAHDAIDPWRLAYEKII